MNQLNFYEKFQGLNSYLSFPFWRMLRLCTIKNKLALWNMKWDMSQRTKYNTKGTQLYIYILKICSIYRTINWYLHGCTKDNLFFEQFRTDDHDTRLYIIYCLLRWDSFWTKPLIFLSKGLFLIDKQRTTKQKKAVVFCAN